MRNRRELAKKALNAAVRLRAEQNIKPNHPVNIFDLANTIGVEVRFVAIPSMEGMYCRSREPKILVSSYRPYVRQVFTCAHELGHHIFQHGSKVDEYLEDRSTSRFFNSDEFLANLFASFLLMPKTLTEYAFHIRKWSPKNALPQHIYSIACWLGVGYSTLITHMRESLDLITADRAQELLRTSPKKLRTELLGFSVSGNLIVVNKNWENRAIDVQVGDYILLPAYSNFEGSCVCPVSQNTTMTLFQGMSPGKGRFVHYESGWSSYVRVSRKDFVGRSVFRHLEDPEYDHNN